MTMILAGTLTAQAADYQYLTIEKTDGTATSLTAVGLNISYSDGKLNATNGTESATLPLSEVSRMYFSNAKEVTAISDLQVLNDDDTATAYDLSGKKIAEGTLAKLRPRLRKGVYIIKQNNKTKKLLVK